MEIGDRGGGPIEEKEIGTEEVTEEEKEIGTEEVTEEEKEVLEIIQEETGEKK